MTKDVLIRITGYQYMGDEGAEPVELITQGQYFLKNGRHYLLYDEVMDEAEGVTRNRVKIENQNSRMEIQKKGSSTVQMIFEKNKKNVTTYRTPYGNIMVGFDCSHFDMRETEEKIEIHTEYGLEMNYEHVSDCKLNMVIQPRESARIL